MQRAARMGGSGGQSVDELIVLNPPKLPIPTSLRRHAGRWKKLKARLSPLVKAALKEGAPLFLSTKRIKPRKIRQIFTSEESLRAIDRFVDESSRQGFVVECKGGTLLPQVESPIFAIPKKEPGKWRIILDMRYINKYQRVPKFKHEGLASISVLIKPGDWTTQGDISQGFHHIPVQKKHQKYLGFSHRGKTYQYVVLPMGSSSSPFIFNKMLRPVLQHLRALGVRMVLYVDDFLILGQSRQECARHTQLVVSTLEDLGWHLNVEKSNFSPSQRTPFLGFVIDTRAQPRVYVPY
tara:strand:+ start:637 stop:1518 length:882 start_codon:yes stop_codon:yes gene_type:complete